MSVSVSLPLVYGMAVEPGAPVVRVRVGAPVTLTGSLKVTVIGMTSPAVNEPSACGDVTFRTVGAAASMTMALLKPSENSVPGSARVRIALFSAASRIVPLLRPRAELET